MAGLAMVAAVASDCSVAMVAMVVADGPAMADAATVGMAALATVTWPRATAIMVAMAVAASGCSVATVATVGTIAAAPSSFLALAARVPPA